MAKAGFVDVSLKQGLVDQIDAYVKQNRLGFSNRAEVVTTAVRQYLEAPRELDHAILQGVYVELAFLLQHAIRTGDPKVDPLERLQTALFEWRRMRLGPE